MPFVLQAEWVKSLMEQAFTGNPEPLLDAIHPDVRWRIGSETKDEVARKGVFVSLSLSLTTLEDVGVEEVPKTETTVSRLIKIVVSSLTDACQNRAQWIDQVLTPLYSKLKDGIKLIGIEVNVIGHKAFLEYHAEATQINGKPYNNFYFWVIIFKEDGKAHEIREYLDTGLTKELFVNN